MDNEKDINTKYSQQNAMNNFFFINIKLYKHTLMLVWYVNEPFDGNQHAFSLIYAKSYSLHSAGNILYLYSFHHPFNPVSSDDCILTDT